MMRNRKKYSKKLIKLNQDTNSKIEKSINSKLSFNLHSSENKAMNSSKNKQSKDKSSSNVSGLLDDEVNSKFVSLNRRLDSSGLNNKIEPKQNKYHYLLSSFSKNKFRFKKSYKPTEPNTEILLTNDKSSIKANHHHYTSMNNPSSKTAKNEQNKLTQNPPTNTPHFQNHSSSKKKIHKKSTKDLITKRPHSKKRNSSKKNILKTKIQK